MSSRRKAKTGRGGGRPPIGGKLSSRREEVIPVKNCVFCNAQTPGEGGDEERKVLELIFGVEERSKGTSFQSFFWRCLLGREAHSLILLEQVRKDGEEEEGRESLSICGGCVKKVEEVEGHHKELEKVEMLLVHLMESIQGLVRSSLEDEKGCMALSYLREQIVAQSERSIKVPMVILEKFVGKLAHPEKKLGGPGGMTILPSLSCLTPPTESDEMEENSEISDADPVTRDDDSGDNDSTLSVDIEEECLTTGIKKRSRSPDGHGKAKLLKKQQSVKDKKAVKILAQRHHTLFRCDLCNRSYFYRNMFEKHSQAHHNHLIKDSDNAWEWRQCPVCKSTFTLQSYYSHVLTHEDKLGDGEPKPFACSEDNCSRRFRIEENLSIHLEVDHDLSTLEEVLSVKKCEECHLCYDNSYHLLAHYRRTHRELFNTKTLLQCAVCAHLFVSSDAMISHTYLHRSSEEQLCFACSRDKQKSFTSRSELLHHLQTEHGFATSKSCDSCEEHFDDIYLADEHSIRIHKKTSTFLCSFCGHSSYFIGSHLKHESTHEKGPPIGFLCQDCPNVGFDDPGKLEAHRIKVHGAEKPHCDICGKEYSSPRAMEMHKRRAHDKTNFHCSECSLFFDGKSSLEQHLNTKHSEARPFTCETCGKAYKTFADLRDHQKIHDRKFECDICGRKFARKKDLKFHSGMHDKSKTVVCEFCGGEFSSIRSCRKHVKIYHTGANRKTTVKPQKRRKARSWWTDTEGNVVHAKKPKTEDSNS